MRGVFRNAVVAVAAAAVSVGGLLAGVAGTAQAAVPPVSTYVSLGDSLAFGYQPNLFDNYHAFAPQDFVSHFKPSDYVSYAEDYAATQSPDLKVANFGCPGETTGSMINGDCPWLTPVPPRYPNGLPLHMSYGPYASQLDAAVAYLKNHRDTSLVSVDIGSNDLLALVRDKCTYKLTCIESNLAATLGSPTKPNTLLGNYWSILSAIHEAAPQAEIVVFNIYNPLAVAVAGSDTLLTDYVNPALQTLVDAFQAATGADIRVADAFDAINHNPDTTLYPTETASVCGLTWMCSPTYPDIHPTTAGYQALATALANAVTS